MFLLHHVLYRLQPYSPRTMLPAEYKYLECLRLDASFKSRYLLRKHIYLQTSKQTVKVDLPSLTLRTSECLPTTVKTHPPPPVAPLAQAAKSCVVLLVLAPTPNAVQLALAALLCVERPVLAALSCVALLVRDATSCKAPHPLIRTTINALFNFNLAFWWSNSQQCTAYFKSRNIPTGFMPFSSTPKIRNNSFQVSIYKDQIQRDYCSSIYLPFYDL